MFWILTIFVLVQTPNGEHVRSYEGQSEETIMNMLSKEGVTGTILTKKKYDEFLANHPRVEPDTTKIKEAIKDLKDKTKTYDERFDALIKYLGL